MSENMIGKRLKFRGEPDHTARTVEKQDHDWTELSDNKRVPTTRVNELFEEVTVDPDAFMGATTTQAQLAQMYDKNVRGGAYEAPVLNIPEKEEINWDEPNQPPAELKGGNAIVTQAPGGQPLPTLPPPPNKDAIAAADREWLIKQGIGVDEEFGKVPTGSPETLGAAPRYASPAAANYRPVAASASFGKFKKTQSVKLNIVLEEKIPEVESIRFINNLFEESIIDQLAGEFTQKYLNDPFLLEEMIKASLEELVYPDRKRRKAPKARKAPAKKAQTGAQNEEA